MIENNFRGIGRFVADPEGRDKDEKTMARFTLAINRRGQDAGTDFIDFVSFSKTAEAILKYFKKGNRIAVSGRVSTGTYTNKDGEKRKSTNIIVEEFAFIENKSGVSSEKPASLKENGFEEITEEEDLPF